MRTVEENDAVKNIEYIRRGMTELQVRLIGRFMQVWPEREETTELGLGVRPNTRVHAQTEPSIPLGRTGKSRIHGVDT